MSLFAWNDKYALACAPIDKEHRMLFKLADDLHTAMIEGRGPSVLKTLLNDLVAYTRRHFGHEEALMRESAFPGAREHKAEHEALVARVAELQKQSDTGKLTVTLDTMRFLRQWLEHHIDKTDRRVADHIRAHAPAGR